MKLRILYNSFPPYQQQGTTRKNWGNISTAGNNKELGEQHPESTNLTLALLAIMLSTSYLLILTQDIIVETVKNTTEDANIYI